MAKPLPLPAVGHELHSLEGNATLRTLFAGDRVRVVQWHCLHDGAGLRAERHHSWAAISVEFTHIAETVCGRRASVIDPTHAVAHLAQVDYSTRHRWGCGCQGCNFSLHPELGDELIERGVRRRAGATDRWPIPVALTRQDLLASRWLAHSLLRGGGHDPLAVEEAVITWCDRLGRLPTRRRRDGASRVETRREHRRLVGEARALLTARFGESLRLDRVARELGASAPHLARVFRSRTGMSLHRFLSRVRLLAVIERASHGDSDLAQVAIDCGFSSHSHMTAAFRKEFSITPSTWRSALEARGFRGAEWWRSPRFGWPEGPSQDRTA
jgi:AraC-like DNA-binding protein